MDRQQPQDEERDGKLDKLGERLEEMTERQDRRPAAGLIHQGAASEEEGGEEEEPVQS